MIKYIQQLRDIKNTDNYSMNKLYGIFINVLLDDNLNNKEKDLFQQLYVEKAKQLGIYIGA